MTDKILKAAPKFLANWFTYEEVKSIFNYKRTKMEALIKSPYMKVSVLDGRKFVSKESVEWLLESKSNTPLKLIK